jgi:hypothetical protein
MAAAAAGCATEPGAPPPQERASIQVLRSSLAQLTGTYEWNDELRRYVFSNAAGIEALVREAADATVRELVECLDDEAASKVTLQGRAVPVGVVCYQALTQLVYYEPTGPSGDIAAEWPGHVEPDATAEDLRAAKEAWQQVVEKKAYIRL